MRIPGAGIIRRSMGTATNLQVNLHRSLTGHRQAVYAICSDAQKFIYSSGGDGLIVRWDPLNSADGTVVAQVPEPIYSLEVLNGKTLLAGGQSGDLYVIDSGNPRRLMAHEKGIFCILQVGNEFLSAGGDGQLIRWSNDFEITHTAELSAKSIRRVIEFDTGFFTAGSDGMVHELNRDCQIQQSWKIHDSSVFSLIWISKQASLISAGRDAQLKFHSPFGGETKADIPAHLLHIHDLKLSPDGKLFASASMDKTIKLWDPETLKLLKVIDAHKFGIHTSSVNALVWLEDNILISASDDRSLGVWQIVT